MGLTADPPPARRLYFSRFRPTQDAGGGCRRLLQLVDDTRSLDLELISSARRLCRLPEQALDRVRHAIDQASVEDGRRDHGWSSERAENALRLHEIARAWVSELPGLDDLELAVLDDPIYFEPLLTALVERHVPVVAFSQNLESLAPEQVQKDRRFDLLARELQLLSSCRLVVTVSREESWLLTNLGIPNLYHRYFPAAPIRDRLLAVRHKREARRCRQGILMVGNAGNLQTLQGMTAAMSHWQQNHLADVAGPLTVAGFHLNERFMPGHYGPGVALVGTLSDQDLDERLAEARACLCYQEGGAGALTRITESLLAGVPVLANAHAARSHHDAPGLVEFDALEGLAGALQRLESVPVGFSAPASPDPTRLVALLRGIAGS